jgi:hypothetical protein
MTQRYAHVILLDRLIADDNTGPWSEEEEARLTQVMQVLEEEGKTPDNTPKFWKMVSECLEWTRICDQCQDKWIAKSGRRIHWRDTNTKTLAKK